MISICVLLQNLFASQLGLRALADPGVADADAELHPDLLRREPDGEGACSW